MSSNVSPAQNQQDEIVAEVTIGAPPERVFQALTDPAQVPKWWGQKGVYRCTEFESDLRVGGKWRSSGVDGRGQNFEVSGTYLEIEPPRLLVTTWIATWTGDVQTSVRWEIQPSAKGSLIRIRHCGVAAHPQLAQSYRGWPRMLGWLQALIERGETVDDRLPASWSQCPSLSDILLDSVLNEPRPFRFGTAKCHNKLPLRTSAPAPHSSL